MTEHKILINHKFSYYFKNDSNKYKSTEENKQQRQKAKEKAIKKSFLLVSKYAIWFRFPSNTLKELHNNAIFTSL